jgi:hypothetical protein
MMRFFKLRSLRKWWATRHCGHGPQGDRQVFIDTGARKMFWCSKCQRTWFS